VGKTGALHFGGLRADAAVANEVLKAVSGNAIDAALAAAEQMQQQRQELRHTITLEVEQARYEARLAARRYEAVDPDQRLVAAELEARWNAAFAKSTGTGKQAERVRQRDPIPAGTEQGSSSEFWRKTFQPSGTHIHRDATEATTGAILVDEMVVDVDEKSNEVVLVLHWAGPSFRTPRKEERNRQTPEVHEHRGDRRHRPDG